MGITNVLKTTTSAASPLDASTGDTSKPPISEFLTIQSLANFAAMVGAITAAWNGLRILNPWFSTPWVPYLFAFAWGVISVSISLSGLKHENSEKFNFGAIGQASFIALLNALVLASAVVGGASVTSQTR